MGLNISVGYILRFWLPPLTIVVIVMISFCPIVSQEQRNNVYHLCRVQERQRYWILLYF